jgi:hypothetical protein
MNGDRPINSMRFLGFWIFCSYAVWPLALIALYLVFLLITALLGLAIPSDTVISPSVGGALVGFSFGLSIGILQKWLARRYLHADLLYWRRLSAFGGILGGATIFVIEGDPFGYGQLFGPPSSGFILAIVIFLVVVSGMQWFSLRHHTQGAWLWLLANVIGVVVWNPILTGNFEPNIFLIPALQGAVTGMTLLWLLGTSRRDRKIKLEEDDPLPKRKPSVWDEAI